MTWNLSVNSQRHFPRLLRWKRRLMQHFPMASTFNAILQFVLLLSRRSNLDQRIAQEDWILVFSHFPNLETFSGGGLWTVGGAKMNRRKLNALILKIAEACPRLRQLEHWQIDEKRGCCKQIVIGRDVNGVEWTIQTLPARCVLFTLGFAFGTLIHKYSRSLGFDSIMDEFE
jgi:hypothetical protein